MSAKVRTVHIEDGNLHINGELFPYKHRVVDGIGRTVKIELEFDELTYVPAKSTPVPSINVDEVERVRKIQAQKAAGFTGR